MIRHTLPPDHNHTTRKFPRTLREAFPQDYPDAWFDATDSIVVAVCVVALIFLIVLIASGN